MEYKKSYKGYVILMFLYILALIGIMFLPIDNPNQITVLIGESMVVWMAILTGVIWKTEKIYWYTGVEYNQVKDLPSEVRKRYGYRHFKRFLIVGILYTIYAVFAYIFKVHWGISTSLVVVVLVAVAISTMNIKLEKM